MTDWNPGLYLKFEKERTQPVKDLISRIELEEPARIIDIGCGPGNSTRELRNRWPKAGIVGLDSSPNMIEKASSEMPELEWVVENASADLSRLGTFDIVFSNAALQWIPDHETLVPALFGLLKSGGVLAVQVPNVDKMPVTFALEAIARDKKWESYMATKEDHFYRHSPEAYYDMLSSLTDQVYLWETDYYHVMTGHQAIIDWYSSTGMRPYFDMLPDEQSRKEFAADVLQQVKKEYKTQQDGNVLFPFKRIFFLAYR